MIITTCGNSEKLAKSLAKKLKVTYSPLTISAFPDGDTYIKYNTNLKSKTVVLVQSFQPDPEKSLINVIFAAENAKDLGAKKVILVAPYLAFMRQDTRFHPGEAISSKIVAKHLNSCIDKIITFDPHIHRYKSLKDIFTCSAIRLTADPLVAEYIKNHWKKAVLVGPDGESSQWAADIAHRIGAESTVFEKHRFSSWHVEVKMVHPIPIKGKDAVIVLKSKGAKSVTAIGVHGLFVNGAIDKLKKAGVSKIVTVNCVEHATNKIDIMPMLAKELRKE
ncbi:ribose-phosphate diphosphokinase [Candidatus Woesearchaeota archaeon]|nr:ribose-phosphate diphosphokinase [Candidatus Woesearchaeota archaeon]